MEEDENAGQTRFAGVYGIERAYDYFKVIRA